MLRSCGDARTPNPSRLNSERFPFVFVTGYRDLSIVPSALRTAPRLDKPVNDDRLIESLRELFTARVG